MTDKPVESRLGFPVGPIAWLLIALALGFWSLLLIANKVKEPGIPGILAIIPLSISVALLLARPSFFSARFPPTHIEVLRPKRMEIPYESLQGLWGKGRSSDPGQPGPYSYPINVIHQGGVLHIPARLNIPSDEVYLYLFKKFPPESAREVAPPLQEHLKEQLQTFGPDRVWAYRGRTHLGFGGTHRRRLFVSLALALAGIPCIIIAIVTKEGGWGVLGGLLLVFGLLFSVLFFSQSKRSMGSIKNWRAASLVISPISLALIQGDLKGELRWEELQDVQLRSRYKTFQVFGGSSGFPGIILKLEGATVTIVDIYDQPPWVIFQRIRNYWK